MKRGAQQPSLFVIYFVVLSVFLLTAVAGSKAVTTITEYGQVDPQQCVIIDAGHGGVDGGATSCTGVLESSINLEIALRLEDLFHLLGIHTVMIRTTDVSIDTEGESIAAKKVSDLKERVRIANETENAILISIHQNYFHDNRYSGAQIFYADTEDSELFAKNMQNLFVKILNPGSKRQTKRAKGVFLMENIKCPGILIECGFISNPAEEAKLRTDAYQKKICSVIASATSLYLHANSIT